MTKIPMGRFEKIAYFTSLIVIMITFAYIITVWHQLPSEVPAHFNTSGEPDRWGRKGNILVLPFLSIFILGLLFTVSRFPQTFNYPIEVTEKNVRKINLLASRLLACLTLSSVLFCALGGIGSVQVAFGKSGLGAWYLPMFFTVNFGLIGYYAIRMVSLKNIPKK